MGAEHFEGVTIQPMINWSGYELIVGSSPDPQFGPVLLFGMGGQLVEVFKDRALALPPLNTNLARHLIDETMIAQALKGVRGRKPIDKDVLAALLVRFSELVAEQPRIAEIDINPLLASPERIIALDARVVLHPASIADADLPRFAIRPYPHEYEREVTTDDGVRFSSGPSARRTSPPRPGSTRACRRDRRRALRHGPPAGRADRARAADQDLLRRLRPPVRAGGRGRGAGTRSGRVRGHGPRVADPRVRGPDAHHDRGRCVAAARRGGPPLRAALDVARARASRTSCSQLRPENTGMRELLEDEGFAFEEADGVLVATLAIK